MSITKKEKLNLVEETAKAIADSKEQLLVGYQGLSVEELQELRGRMREQGISMKILKNTLLDLAFEKAAIKGLKIKDVKKPTALVYGQDEVAPAKIVVEFSKDHEKLELLSGVIDNKVMETQLIKQLASLPGREEMLGKVVGTIAAPLSSFVRVLAGPGRSLVGVLSAIGESKS